MQRVVFFAFAILGGFAGGPASAASLPVVPAGVKIIAPAEDVDRAKAIYSGVWEGAWRGGVFSDWYLDARIIVALVTNAGADVYYIWGEYPQPVDRPLAGVRPGWRRLWGTFKDSGELWFRLPNGTEISMRSPQGDKTSASLRPPVGTGASGTFLRIGD